MLNILRARRSVGFPFIRALSTKERAGKGVKPGAALVLDDIPHRVTKIVQGKRGKGGGFVRATLKNLISSQTFEKTFTSDEVVEMAAMEKEPAHFSWADSNSCMFMNTETFEEVRVPKEDIDNMEFLFEGLEVKLVKFRDSVIGVELPNVVVYDVVSVDDTKEAGGMVPSVLNSGASIMVPKFIKDGMKIRVNTYDRSYVERA